MKTAQLITLYCLLLCNALCSGAQVVSIEAPELVEVEGGSFLFGATKEQSQYGNSDEKPATAVTLDTFFMGKYEVTNEEFARFLTEQGNRSEGGDHWYRIDKHSLIKQSREGAFAPKTGYDDYPVNNVSWYGAAAYTKWLAGRTKMPYRLPTEAEWEFASRGGLRSKGFVYSGSDRIEDVAWTDDFAAKSGTGWGFKNDKGPHPVGEKAPNELGIFDMSGNLSEWVADLYENHPPADAVNPRGPAFGSLRVQRGGSWDANPSDCRSSARGYEEPVSRFSANDGFRVALDARRIPSESIRRHAREHGFSGTVLVSRRGRIIYLESFGLADIDENLPLSDATPYSIASITKLFTSTLTLLLVEEGKLGLHRTISTYLPEYSGEGAQEITIHHLLTHTSGIGDPEAIHTGDNPLPDVYVKEHTLEELIATYCSGPLRQRPGTGFYYNNADYIVLGRIIESVTGQAYSNVLRDRILVPLGMNDSGILDKSVSNPRVPQSYKWDAESETYAKDPPREISNYFAAGSMFSTAADLNTFAHALFSGTLLEKSSLKLLLRTYPESESYGYGLWVRYPRYGRHVPKVAQRFGRIWGINTFVSHFLEHGITVIVLSNTDRVSVASFQDVVGEGFLGGDPE